MHLTTDDRYQGLDEEVSDLEVAGVGPLSGQASAEDQDDGQDRDRSRTRRLQHGTTLSTVLWIGLAFVLGACDATSPSTEPSTPRSRMPVACIGLLAAQCEQALSTLAAKLPGVTPSYVAISQRLCDGPCPGSERGVWLGHLMVEFSDGRKPQTILIEVDGDAIDWEPIESALVEVTPRSPRLTGPTTELTLGHCGLGSGIDIDGSFWDPIGMIDRDEEALINTANARFTLTSPDNGILVTEGGAVLQLVRHQGPKFFFLCD